MNRKVENVVMNGPEVGKLGKEQNLKSIVMNGVKKGRRHGEERRDEWSQKWKIGKL